MKTFLMLAASAAALAAVPASAATFSFSYSYDLTRTNTITVSGTLTGEQVAGTSSFLIIGATGTRSAALSAVGDYTITGVAAVGSYNGNDNLLTLFSPRSATAPTYYTPSVNGIAFTETPGPSPVRLFSTADFQRSDLGQENFTQANGTQVTAPVTGFALTITRTDVDGAVPEPATWGLMLAGFGLIGAGLRARRRRVAFA